MARASTSPPAGHRALAPTQAGKHQGPASGCFSCVAWAAPQQAYSWLRTAHQRKLKLTCCRPNAALGHGHGAIAGIDARSCVQERRGARGLPGPARLKLLRPRPETGVTGLLRVQRISDCEGSLQAVSRRLRFLSCTWFAEHVGASAFSDFKDQGRSAGSPVPPPG